MQFYFRFCGLLAMFNDYPAIFRHHGVSGYPAAIHQHYFFAGNGTQRLEQMLPIPFIQFNRRTRQIDFFTIKAMHKCFLT